MALLVYCVTLIEAEAVQVATEVCGSTAHAREHSGLRLYVSEMRDPETCVGSADAVKQSALSFHQVLRDILAHTTLLPFRFPTMFETEESLEQHLQSEGEGYIAALQRIGNAVQYELIGTWAADAQTDTAKPVSGREYLERRQHQMARVTALEEKLKSVAGDAVREWRSRQERGTHRWFALVDRANRERFLSSLRSAGGSEGVRLRLSGPWPPSEFLAESRTHG